MSKFTVTSEVINCSIERAFDYISDVENRPNWQRPLDKVNRGSPAPDGAGTYWTEDFKMLGMTHVARMSYTEFDRPNVFVEDADLPLCTGRIDMIFKEVDGGCTLAVVSDVNWKGIYKFLTPILVRTFKKMVLQDLEDIKRLLES
ncbi:SRPBCC family protein [Aliiroseovarius sp. 2305UL8-7]|uniref:SRPBCC family protein n=1 Tax=Aliiroseovarius conchicola TaxID=3121637 RepID=UPI003528C952